MKQTRLNLFLGLLMLGLVVLAAFLGRDLSQPNVEFLPDMKHSPAYGAFSPNENLPGGRTLQPPVAGTIARGEQPLHYAATKEDALRAGEELVNPLAGKNKELARSVKRGAAVFRIHCVACHGGSGNGDGPVTKRGFPPPPSLLTGKSLKMKDGQLFHILTYGQGNMAPVAGQLSPAERWDAINFVRHLQQQFAAQQKRQQKQKKQQQKQQRQKKQQPPS